MARKHSESIHKLVEPAESHIQVLNAAELSTKLKQKEDFILIDVREDREWDQGHIPTAIHLARGIIEFYIEKQTPDHQAELVLYCRGGYRALLAADSLQKMGYKNVKSLTGGCGAWVDAGYEFDGELLR